MTMHYEPRQKENGDVEVWRRILESEWPEELVATFHDYGKGTRKGAVALLNASQFCDEQNLRERALREVVEALHRHEP